MRILERIFWAIVESTPNAFTSLVWRRFNRYFK